MQVLSLDSLFQANAKEFFLMRYTTMLLVQDQVCLNTCKMSSFMSVVEQADDPEIKRSFAVELVMEGSIVITSRRRVNLNFFSGTRVKSADTCTRRINIVGSFMILAFLFL